MQQLHSKQCISICFSKVEPACRCKKTSCGNERAATCKQCSSEPSPAAAARGVAGGTATPCTKRAFEELEATILLRHGARASLSSGAACDHGKRVVGIQQAILARWCSSIRGEFAAQALRQGHFQCGKSPRRRVEHRLSVLRHAFTQDCNEGLLGVGAFGVSWHTQKCTHHGSGRRTSRMARTRPSLENESQ